MKNKYLNIHNHTYYSYLDSLAKPEEIIKQSRELGHIAVCSTDHGNASSHPTMFQEAKKQGVKYIPGVEFYFTENHETKDRKSNHLTAIAQNNTGLSNIYKLLTIANTPVDSGGGFHYKPRISFKDLEKYNEGIIITTGCMASKINRSFIESGYDEGYKYAIKFLDIFGKERLFAECQDTNDSHSDINLIYIPEQIKILEYTRRLSVELGIKPVACNDSHYVLPEDEEVHEVLKAIESKMTLSSPIASDGERGRIKYNGHTYFIQGLNDLKKRFTDEEINNTGSIADLCNVKMAFGEKHMPKFNKDLSDEDAYKMLLKECRDGWKKLNIKNLKNNKIYEERIKVELADIKDAGLQHYFLIVWDVLRFCNQNKIGRGFGRGSAAGSLVSYLLDITKVDPIKYGLIWERFWNKGRKDGLPDIDVDVSIERREEIVNYIREKFGKDRVFPMMTVGTMSTKQALKDVGKVLGLSFEYMNDLTDHVPHKCASIKEAIETNDYIRMVSEGKDKDIIKWETEKNINQQNNIKINELEYYISQRQEQLLKTFKIAQRLEGIARQRSTHACALLIADEDIFGKIPLLWDTNNKRIITGFDMYELEKLGYMKLDILGLKTISVLENIVPEGIDYVINKSPEFDDKNVYDLICAGNVKGIFQLESPLGKGWCKKLKPKNLDEISDLISLIRPAVLETGLADQYIKNKNNPDQIEYIHPDLEPILKSTKGIMLFQEQMLEILKKFAGFSLVEADLARKATGKKLPEEMAKLKDRFINGCLNNKYDKDISEKIWEWINATAGYSFNKSHSISYAMMSYATAYFKYYFPEKFVCSMLNLANNESSPHEEISEIFYDSKPFKIEIKPPNINKSNVSFKLEDGKIYYGLGSIRHVGESTIKKLIGLKNTNWEEVVKNRTSIKKDVVRGMILSGAFDCFKKTRSTMLIEMDFRNELTDKQESIFNSILDGLSYNKGKKSIKFDKSDGFKDAIIKFHSFLSNENNSLKMINSNVKDGLIHLCNKTLENIENKDYLSNVALATYENYYLGAPILHDQIDSYFDRRMTHHIVEIGKALEGSNISLIAIIKNIKETKDKNEREMCFLTMVDKTGLADSILFHSKYDEYKEKLRVDCAYFIQGVKRKNSLIINYLEVL